MPKVVGAALTSTSISSTKNPHSTKSANGTRTPRMACIALVTWVWTQLVEPQSATPGAKVKSKVITKATPGVSTKPPKQPNKICALIKTAKTPSANWDSMSTAVAKPVR